MNIDIIIPSQHLPITESFFMGDASHAADRAARAYLFAEERARRSANTIRRHNADLAVFARYLLAVGLPPVPVDAAGVVLLATSAEPWAGMSWGMVKGFAAWMLTEGYAMASVNARLATVRLYASWAAQAGMLPAEMVVLIKGVKGYAHRDAHNLDAARPITRIGAKKATFHVLSRDQVRRLKVQPDTPQGRRDGVLLHLLLDHGLRCGEVARLQAGSIDPERGTMTFYRPKVYKTQTHTLTPGTQAALVAYLGKDVPLTGSLLWASRKSGHLTTSGMSERAITSRVAELGRGLGIAQLSAHDLRHTWATLAARAGTPVDRLQDAGGWNSPVMALRYLEAAAIANTGVRGFHDEA
ncbi:MAG: tyrosine-type recombinase/integrase [Herpetosiphonaceae bacterium]|nr:tyrosine-type recombinase/integrase [Herpetosiphonaceae bacterium]